MLLEIIYFIPYGPRPSISIDPSGSDYFVTDSTRTFIWIKWKVLNSSVIWGPSNKITGKKHVIGTLVEQVKNTK